MPMTFRQFLKKKRLALDLSLCEFAKRGGMCNPRIAEPHLPSVIGFFRDYARILP